MKTPALLLIAAASAAYAADPAITIYNNNFAVVRETFEVELKAGDNNVTFSGATAAVDPDSVILRDAAGKAEFKILEQSYRDDPVTELLLLSMFEGKTIEFLHHESQKPDRVVLGKVIRSGYARDRDYRLDPIIEVDGKLQFSLPGEPRFPSLGETNILKPTLNWKLDSLQAAKFNAEVAYLSGGFKWEASYNIIASEKSDMIDLVGWVTMENISGTTFTDARVKLMAGDIEKSPTRERMSSRRNYEFAVGAGGGSSRRYGEPVVSERSFDEFHLYSLALPVTLRDKEVKQVEFTRASGIKSSRLYIVESQVNVVEPVKVQVWREFRNSEANKLGIALPKGTVRFYAQDEDKQLEFVGDNKIEHTAKDELIRVRAGNSFDLVGERRIVEASRDEANRKAQMTVEVKLRNRKTEAATVVVRETTEPVDWKLLAQSQPHVRKDARTFEFNVTLAPGEEKTVNYTIELNW